MFKLLKENVHIAMGSIRTQLLRTILTVLIIAIGITALVGILTLVSALENTISGNFSSMGANTFSMGQYDASAQINRNNNVEKINPIISYPQAKAFQEKYSYPFTSTSLSFTATSTAEIKFENKKTDPDISVLGVDENFLINSGLETQMGRNFTGFDIQNNNYVCVVGSDFLKGLLKDINPIDKVLSIRGAKFRVIGVLKEKGSTFGNSQDLRVLIPTQIARSLFTAPNINYDLKVLVGKEELLDAAVDDAIITMRKVRKLNPVEENNFGITRSDELLEMLRSQTEFMGYAAWIIGIITVFGSSIALMNIMIVSVTERTREIGVRKALGAKRSTIAFQFFTESLVIGQLGGFVGIILGVLIGYGISTGLDFEFVAPWKAIIAAVIISFIVALFSGLYPAIKAAYLDPIEALRYE
ncbi:putative ABC transport system permease protein [Flavobacterium gossypii]|uniref:ABC transport system permease protein n=2 Tax=Flavobacterium TaxID=237 RepID=A0ABR6DMD6_9FLAO|nr:MULTISPECIES: ABC transporter permease [Flavobacterium]MBA9072619.1 putative ABC transport system permease protein [Flavobacterium gossypii]RKS25640.1 putative ABC transport system permease protein [Flavobacterium endophyticum]WDO13097.1 ABC transporter permease [Flavobacterium sp. WW92]